MSSSNSPSSPAGSKSSKPHAVLSTAELSPMQRLFLAATGNEALGEFPACITMLENAMHAKLRYGDKEANSLPELKDAQQVAFYHSIAISSEMQSMGTEASFSRGGLCEKAANLGYGFLSQQEQAALMTVYMLRSMPLHIAQLIIQLKTEHAKNQRAARVN